MDKRLQKRHKRQVTRARQHIKISEPDVRTPEQIQAAREASGAAEVIGKGLGAQKGVPSFRGGHAPAIGGASKTDTSG